MVLEQTSLCLGTKRVIFIFSFEGTRLRARLVYFALFRCLRGGGWTVGEWSRMETTVVMHE